jgi:hypothetical protein
MTDRYERNPAHLAVIANALRERRTTPRHTTVVTALLVVALVACGGGKKRTDTYAKATDALGDCCENLKGAERDQCLGDIVRVEDPEAAKTTTAQATYACVVEHFVCNPQTGRPTQASAQAQYDCIEDQAR